MSNRFYVFGNNPHEIEAAMHLKHRAMIMVAVHNQQKEVISRLLQTGFILTPEYIDSIIQFPFKPSNLSQKHKKQLIDSLNFWHSNKLSLSIHQLSSITKEELIENLYQKIFLPEFYSKGISPHNLHNQKNFERLLNDENYFALVVKDNEIVGGAVLRPHTIAGEIKIIKGKKVSGRGVEGLVNALRGDLKKCNRALIYHLIVAFESIGLSFLSLGKDLSLIEDGYMNVMLEKWRWCDHILVNFPVEAQYFFPGPKKITDLKGMHVITLDNNDGITVNRFGLKDQNMQNRLNRYLSGLSYQNYST